MRISILGSGSWGSALAIAFSHIGSVVLWGRNQLQMQDMQHTRTNSGYLPNDIIFPVNIKFTTQLGDILGSDLLVVATPVNALREVLEHVRSIYEGYSNIKTITNDNNNAGTDDGAGIGNNINLSLPPIIWVSKGFENGSGLLPSQIIYDIFGDISNNVGALLGPSFAKEVALGLPTAVTFSSTNYDFAFKLTLQFCNIPNFRVYAHDDLIGSEVGAGVKNIIAIAVGISDGLQLGFNARAGLITRSLSELSRLVVQIGGKANTVYGLSGVGDLILTCTGDLSRNRNVGLELATGADIESILAKLGHVAEGVYATKEVYNLSKQQKIEMPIVEAVYNIIYNKCDIKQAVFGLLNRESKGEFI